MRGSVAVRWAGARVEPVRHREWHDVDRRRRPRGDHPPPLRPAADDHGVSRIGDGPVARGAALGDVGLAVAGHVVQADHDAWQRGRGSAPCMWPPPRPDWHRRACRSRAGGRRRRLPGAAAGRPAGQVGPPASLRWRRAPGRDGRRRARPGRPRHGTRSVRIRGAGRRSHRLQEVVARLEAQPPEVVQLRQPPVHRPVLPTVVEPAGVGHQLGDPGAIDAAPAGATGGGRRRHRTTPAARRRRERGSRSRCPRRRSRRTTGRTRRGGPTWIGRCRSSATRTARGGARRRDAHRVATEAVT